MDKPERPKEPKRALRGIRVIEMAQAAAGPLCGSYLTALGADVIKIERPDLGDLSRNTPPYASRSGVIPVRADDDDMATTILKRNRGKRSIALDLTMEDGRDVLLGLVERSDAVIENFRPGVTKKLRIDYAHLRERRPGLLYCSITGFGTNGPYSQWPAFDTIIQGAAGVMAMTGFPGQPPTKAGVIVADAFAPLFATAAILAALRHRDNTGEGQFIDVSMFDCLLSILWDEPIEYYVSTGIPTRPGNRVLRMAPWNAYRTSDGYVVICAGHGAHWHSLAWIMGRPSLAEDPRFATMEDRLLHVDVLDSEIERWTRSMTRQQVLDACVARNVPCGPVNELADLVEDRHLRSRDLLEPLMHPVYGAIPDAAAARYPVRFSELDTQYEDPAPRLGQHTTEILTNVLDLDGDEIERLTRSGALG